MSELPLPSGHEGERVVLEDNDSVQRWTALLGCSERQLREAILKVGDKSDDVLSFLSREM